MSHMNLPLLGEIGGPGVIWEPIADRLISNQAEAVISWTGDFDVVMVDISGAKPVTDNVEARVQLSGDGGSTFDSGASDYYNRSHWWSSGQATQGNAQAYGLLTNTTSGSNAQGNDVNEVLAAQLFFARPLDAGTKTQVIGTGGYAAPNSAALSTMVFFQRDTAKRTDAMKMFYSSGNISVARIIAAGLRLS